MFPVLDYSKDAFNVRKPYATTSDLNAYKDVLTQVTTPDLSRWIPDPATLLAYGIAPPGVPPAVPFPPPNIYEEHQNAAVYQDQVLEEQDNEDSGQESKQHTDSEEEQQRDVGWRQDPHDEFSQRQDAAAFDTEEQQQRKQDPRSQSQNAAFDTEQQQQRSGKFSQSQDAEDQQQRSSKFSRKQERSAVKGFGGRQEPRNNLQGAVSHRNSVGWRQQPRGNLQKQAARRKEGTTVDDTFPRILNKISPSVVTSNWVAIIIGSVLLLILFFVLIASFCKK